MTHQLICLINQPAGMGDILYTLQIAFVYSSRNYRVIWPIIKEYLWIKEYIQTPSITFINDEEDYPMKILVRERYPEVLHMDNGNLYLPLSRSSVNTIGQYFPLMLSKYAMLGLQKLSRNWPYFIHISRKKEQERLVSSYYNISHHDEYIFCNTLIGSPDGHLQALPQMELAINKLSKSNRYRIINNTFVPKTTLFDFIPILTNAKEIHLPNSALSWVIEYLVQNNLCRSDQKRFCYPRDRQNPINDNYKYMKGCWDESNWFFVHPS